MSQIEERVEHARDLEERIRRAKTHIEFGRTIIEHYKRLLEKHRADNRDTTPVEHLLEAFERSQKVFEYDLSELERRRGSAS